MEKKYVVVKFHDKEKYAVGVFRNTLHECEIDAAKANGIYHDLPYIHFGIYEAGHYDMCLDLERRGEGDMYELLATTNYSERIMVA